MVMARFLLRVVAIAFPIIEILLIAWVWRTIGWAWTLVLLGAGFVLGLWLMRKAGAKAFRSIAEPMRSRQPYVELDETTGTARTVHPAQNPPSAEEMEQASADLRRSGLLFVSGALFAIPGFMTDAIAALLLLPASRRLVADRLPTSRRRTVIIQGETVVAHTPGQPTEPERGPAVIRGEILPPQHPIE